MRTTLSTLLPAFLALLGKDLLLFLRDRRALLLNLLAPVLIAAFFGYLFGGSGAGGKSAPLPIAVSDLDRSALSAKIVAGLSADPALAVQLLAPEAAAQQVRQGKLRAAVVLPAGLGAQAGLALFGAGPRPVLQLLHDPSQTATLGLLRGLLSQQLMTLISADVFSPQGQSFARLRERSQRDAGIPPAQREALSQLFGAAARLQPAAASAASAGGAAGAGEGALRQPYELQLQEAVAEGSVRGYNAFAHSFAGMGVQFILLLGVEMGVALLMLRRQDLWKRLRAAPLSRALLLGSRAASSALIALGLFSAIMAVGIAVFGVRVQGSWLGLVLLLAAFALFTACFGLMIAALGGTPEATRGLAIVATLMMVMLGGAWVPSFIFPDWLQTVTLAMPTRWAVDGLDAMTWRGQGLEAALPAVGVLLGFALLCALLALWRFRWEE